MKKKLLPLAMLAGLAGAAGTAQAVHVNPDGLGSVLLYPYYTVEGSQDTFFTVVNTTDAVKAVKVRLLESMNSAEVIDFNLYLSPYDHWAGVITASGEGAVLKTADTSCTVPAIPANGVALRNLLFTTTGTNNDNADGGPAGLERTREGYIEIIEMGVLDDTVTDAFGAAAAATHGASGNPTNCALLVDAWEEAPVNSGNVVGEWVNPSANFMDFLDAQSEGLIGGLYGYGTIISVTEGTNSTYSAVALDDFSESNLHARPGDTAPNLGSGVVFADIIDGISIEEFEFDDPLHAVSAAIMHDTISNDYVMEPGILAGTDWVVTFPTKREYVYATGMTEATEPFTNIWAAGAACEEVQVEHWDREERVTDVPPVAGGVDFSPSPVPEEVEVIGFALCSEANVITFMNPDAEVSDDGEILSGVVSALYPSERSQYGLRTSFNNGWARISFATDNSGNERVLTDIDGNTILGLPLIGFAVQKYSNSAVGAEGAFYSGVIEHKTTRLINP